MLVVRIDEKTAIQAKAPTKPDVMCEPVRREQEYTRNGTHGLFAALKVHAGDVLGMVSTTRNRFDLIRFLELSDAEIAVVDGQQIVAIPSCRLLKDGIFTSEQDLAEQMPAFIETYNQTAKPFKWTYAGKVLEA